MRLRETFFTESLHKFSSKIPEPVQIDLNKIIVCSMLIVYTDTCVAGSIVLIDN